MTRCNNWICVLATLLLVTGNTQAQPQYRFQHLNTKHGLANEFAWTMAQDSLGYIWIGYTGGLSRWDGYNFKLYKFNPTDSLASTPDFIHMQIGVDESKRLWLGGHPVVNGIAQMAKHNVRGGTFTTYKFPEIKTGLRTRVFEQDGNMVWLGTPEGLYEFQLNTGKLASFINESAEKIAQNQIVGLKLIGNKILVATELGLWLFDKGTKQFSRPACNPEHATILYQTGFINILESPNWKEPYTWLSAETQLIKIDSTFSIVHRQVWPAGIRVGAWTWDRDRNGVFWFATNLGGGGLNIFDPHTNELRVVKHNPEDPWSLRSDDVLDVLVDRDDNIWVGTARGISVMKKQALTFHNIKINSGVGASAVLHAKDRDYLIVSVNQGQGLAIPRQIYSAEMDGRPLEAIKLTPTQLLSANGVTTFFYQGENHLWTNVKQGNSPMQIVGYPIERVINPLTELKTRIIEHDPRNPNGIRSGALNAAFVWEDHDGNLFLPYLNGGSIDVVRSEVMYGSEGSVDKLDIPDARLFLPENDSAFWVARNRHKSLDLYTFPKGQPTKGHLIHVLDIADLPTLIYRTKDGRVLMGTLAGIYEGIQVGGNYKFTKLPWLNTAILQIEEDKEGRIWIFADNKLTCYDRENSTATAFGELDGLEHFVHFRNSETKSLHFTANGIMALTSPDGISLFNPSTFKISRKKIHPVLTELTINNQVVQERKIVGDKDFSTTADIGVLKELTLDYQHNNFSIEFSAMEMTAPEKNLYQHMLESYDKDWIETDYKNRAATYTNLPYGTYTFRVKASNHHGVWSGNERTLKVIILPPPWRTWWAYAGYGLLVLGLLYWARSNIVQRERLKSNLAMAKVEQEKEHFELEKAKEVDKVKTSFFTNISHEFRTPLTLIKGPVQNILDRYKDDPKLQEQLKLVQRNSDLLLKLINQLLDLAKLESGSLKVEKTEGDVFSFVRAIASSFESFARQKNISIQINVPEGSCPALFDKDKVETIIINLINNAIKFTPSGGDVTAIAEVHHEQLITNNQQLTLRVKDTGIGIPKEQQTKIFERFHQVSEAHKEVGTGIGLALVKELVALMGGEISVTSEVGVGSEFIVQIPIELVPGSELQVSSYNQVLVESQFANESTTRNLKPETRNSEAETRNPELATILVVEDNTDLRHFIIDSLGTEFHFLEAENGKQGLEKATSEVPDLIISDVMMPEMDGITMAGKIKKDIRSSHIPLILLTAKSTEDSKLHGLASGADDYLTKPFNKNELLLKVRNGVSRQLKLREKLRAELMSTAPKVEVLSADEQFLVKVKDTILNRLSDEQLSVESLADDIGLSRVQLYRKITALTGISVNELIRKLRLQKASQLLQQNWGPVSQVAYEVGFSNLSYFSKVFKEEFGVLPSEYHSVEK